MSDCVDFSHNQTGKKRLLRALCGLERSGREIKSLALYLTGIPLHFFL